jgi:TubC N-terminal docking domain
MTLIAELAARSIALTAKGDTLHVKAPPGALTPGLRDEIKAHKPELLKALSVKLYCAACRNLRMAEVMIPGEGRRYVWGCARGHMEHGHTTPNLHRLIAPESCLKAGDYLPIKGPPPAKPGVIRNSVMMTE